jgi:hypothetical protein
MGGREREGGKGRITVWGNGEVEPGGEEKEGRNEEKGKGSKEERKEVKEERKEEEGGGRRRRKEEGGRRRKEEEGGPYMHRGIDSVDQVVLVHLYHKWNRSSCNSVMMLKSGE